MNALSRLSPGARYVLRAVLVAGLGYVTAVLTKGELQSFDWQTFAWGLLGALAGAAYAAIGYLTPVEPFVGIHKKPVEVPASLAVTKERS